jgi:ABC-2 type transport system permease protein
MHSLHLVWLFLRISALNELQYRVNFFLQLLQSLIALVPAGRPEHRLPVHRLLRGWTHSELLAVLGVLHADRRRDPHPDPAEHGAADGGHPGRHARLALTKPADAQLLVSVRGASGERPRCCSA